MKPPCVACVRCELMRRAGRINPDLRSLSQRLTDESRFHRHGIGPLVCRAAFFDGEPNPLRRKMLYSIGRFVGSKASDAFVLSGRIVFCEKPGPLFRTMTFLCRIVGGEKPGPLFRTML